MRLVLCKAITLLQSFVNQGSGVTTKELTMDILLGVCGALSLLFQAVGLFSPAWLIFDMSINMQGTQITENIGLGLFTGHGCVDTGEGKQCAAFTMDKLADAISASEQPDANKSAAQGLLGNFLPLQLLTIFGAMTSFTALVAVIVYGRKSRLDSPRKCPGVLGAFLWIFSGIMLTAAVCYEANQYSNFKNGEAMISKMPEISDKIQFSVHFPWAPGMTAVGALLGFLTGLIVSIRLCYSGNKDDAGMVGTWNKFTNQAI